MTTATLEPRTTGFLPALGDALDVVDRLAMEPLERLSDDELGQATAGTAQLEAQVSARRHALLAEAERRRVADRTADTGTDAWAARLTGDTREVMRGGMLLAQDLAERFHSTRDAFASGRINLAQVRVIVRAARQAPPGATPGQVADAEQWLVDQATGAGTRSGRGLDAKRLRQAARRMFARIDAELAIRHEAILLGRESRHAEVMTYLQLSDNGDGSWSGRFTIPELHGHLFKQALERLTAPRRLSRDAAGRQVVDPTVRTGNVDELRGQALCELLEHCRPTVMPPTASPCWSPWSSNGSWTASVRPGWTPGSPSLAETRAGSRATPVSCRWSSTVPLGPSTSAAPSGCTPMPSARPSLPSTTPAGSTAASGRSPGARSTTSRRGRRVEPPTSPTPSPSAVTTTDARTTTASTSAGNPEAAGGSIPADRPRR
jgi:hypothetical protein